MYRFFNQDHYFAAMDWLSYDEKAKKLMSKCFNATKNFSQLYNELLNARNLRDHYKNLCDKYEEKLLPRI
jgi:hypothetical protein